MHTDIHGYLFACIHTCMHTLIQGLAHEWIHTLCMDTCTHEYILASLHGYILAWMHTYLHRPTYLATYKMTCRKLGMNSIESAQILVLCHIVPRIRRLYNVHRFEARSLQLRSQETWDKSQQLPMSVQADKAEELRVAEVVCPQRTAGIIERRKKEPEERAGSKTGSKKGDADERCLQVRYYTWRECEMIPSIRSLLISVHRTTAIFSIARALCFHQRLSLCLSAGTAVSACLLRTSRAAYLHACWLPFCLPVWLPGC